MISPLDETSIAFS